MSSAHAHAADMHGRTPLHHAVHKGDKGAVMQLIEGWADVEARTAAGNTPLHVAAQAGHIGLLPFLITASTLDQQNNQGLTPLQLALMYQHWEAAAVLVAAGAAPQGPVRNPRLSSLAAAFDSTPAPLQLLKAVLADPGSDGLLAQALRWRDHLGRTALHRAAADGSLRQVCSLLKAGANKHAKEASGASPLLLAVQHGHVQLVPLLATPGTLQQGMLTCGSPLHVAVKKGNVLMVAALLAAGADVHACNSCGHSPLDPAVNKGDHLVMAVLLAGGARAEAQPWDSRRLQLLAVADQQGCQNAAKALLKAATAASNTQDSAGSSPRAAAADWVDTCMVKLQRAAQAAACSQGSSTGGGSSGGGGEGNSSSSNRRGSSSSGSGSNSSSLAAAAAKGDMQDVAIHLEALAIQCGLRQHLEQAGEQGGQAQGQQQQQVQDKLAALVAAVVVPRARTLQGAPRCAQLLGVVLDVLGPGVAREVCREVHQQLVDENWPGKRFRYPKQGMVGDRNNRLAEALLLGWLGAEERRLVLARLQCLVPGVRRSNQGQQGMSAQQRQQVLFQMEQLVKGAVLACVAAGVKQRVSGHMGQCAALHLQLSSSDVNSTSTVGCSSTPFLQQQTPPPPPPRPQQQQPPPPPPPRPQQRDQTRLPPTHQGCFRPGRQPAAGGAAEKAPVPWLVKLLHQGLEAAGLDRVVKANWAVPGPEDMTDLYAYFCRTLHAHDAFLSGWVAARDRLPSQACGPRLVAAVVTAVRAAQQGMTQQGAVPNEGQGQQQQEQEQADVAKQPQPPPWQQQQQEEEEQEEKCVPNEDHHHYQQQQQQQAGVTETPQSLPSQQRQQQEEEEGEDECVPKEHQHHQQQQQAGASEMPQPPPWQQQQQRVEEAAADGEEEELLCDLLALLQPADEEAAAAGQVAL